MHGSTPGHQSSPVATLGEGELLRLGEWVRDVSLTLGGGSLIDPLEAMLFHEALTDAIDTLSARQSMREAMQKHSGYEDVSAPALPISLEDSAQQIIDRAFADDFSGPPPQAEQAARIHFALSLDPHCSDAYVIQGCLDERAGRYQQAQAAYERAMELAAEKLDPDAFTEASRKAERIHFWYSSGTREYMRPRAALAYLLWRKMGQLKQALTHSRPCWTLTPATIRATAMRCCVVCWKQPTTRRLGRRWPTGILMLARRLSHKILLAPSGTTRTPAGCSERIRPLLRVKGAREQPPP